MSDEHKPVNGAFVCSVCGVTRQTPLGIQRHRDRHRRVSIDE